ncbi:hypothetical protein ACFFWD_34110 [Bradyrhizobium erythrophlei]|uniref:hypothetical protein n=1 Tax=Bradyrhizobium erythrophlei TaxID=1437360 RepID=UPI0035EA3CA8
MYIVSIWLGKGRCPEYRLAIVNSVRRAVLRAIGIPKDGYRVFVFEKELPDVRQDRGCSCLAGENSVVISFSFDVASGVQTVLLDTVEQNLAENPGIPCEDIHMSLIRCAVAG